MMLLYTMIGKRIMVRRNSKGNSKPQKIISCLVGKNAKEMIAQTAIQGAAIVVEKMLLKPYSKVFQKAY